MAAYSGTIVENWTPATLTTELAIYASGTQSVVPINGGVDMLVIGFA